MVDPLADVVGLLQPQAPFAKLSSAAGAWAVRRAETGRPFYCAILDGSSRLAVDGHTPMVLTTGDFVLIPAASGFTASSLKPPSPKHVSRHVTLPSGEVRHGNPNGPADVRMLVGYCDFASPDASLLVSLLPSQIIVRGEPRLATLLELAREEFRARRPARDVILTRLVEILLIEALRSSAGTAASPGLVRGLADERVAGAIRRIHQHPQRPWTVAMLAKTAALSRSAFFDRFHRTVGLTPMDYVLTWRMALAKNLLKQDKLRIADVAERIGYGSASAFSIAFSRHVGTPPSRFSQDARNAAPS